MGCTFRVGGDKETGAGERALVCGEGGSSVGQFAVGSVGFEGIGVLRALSAMVLVAGERRRMDTFFELEGDAAAPSTFGVTGICGKMLRRVEGGGGRGAHTNED